MDPHLTIEHIGIIIDTLFGTVHSIQHDTLDYGNNSTRSIPKLLTKELKEKRISCSKKMHLKHDPCDPRRLYEIVPGVETWIKFTETTRK